jgi:hypothetical protein
MLLSDISGTVKGNLPFAGTTSELINLLLSAADVADVAFIQTSTVIPAAVVFVITAEMFLTTPVVDAGAAS